MSPRPLLLFDLDGTLLDAAGAGRAALQRTADRLFGEALDFEAVATAGRLDGAIFAEAAALAGWLDFADRHMLLCEAYPDELARELSQRGTRVRLLPGAAELLSALRDIADGDPLAGPIIACLTGNMGSAARVKMRAVGLREDVFDLAVYGDEAETRDALVEIALARFESLTGEPALRGRVMVIGDTPHDIRCAQAHGCRAIAVATGGFAVEDLTAAGGDHVLPNLCDTDAVVRLLLTTNHA